MKNVLATAVLALGLSSSFAHATAAWNSEIWAGNQFAQSAWAQMDVSTQIDNYLKEIMASYPEVDVYVVSPDSEEVLSEVKAFYELLKSGSTEKRDFIHLACKNAGC